MPQTGFSTIKTLGIVGAGAMGRGIAQLSAQAGVMTFIHDLNTTAIEEAVDFVNGIWGRQAAKGKVTYEQVSSWSSILHPATELAELAKCDIIIEAIVENLEAKQSLFEDLESLVSSGTILATNTSSLSVASIASTCKHPERVIGFHFFNPAPLMKVAEIIPGQRTSEEVVSRVECLGKSMGHFMARATDTPGFLINHAGRAYITEALKILSEGVADHYAIDRILTSQGGFRMGPFALMDLTSLDVTHIATEAIYHQYYEEPRLRPSVITKRRLESGLLGKKSKEGFYLYENGNPVLPDEENVLPAVAPLPVWIGTNDSSLRSELSRIVQEAGWEIELGNSPSTSALCLITPLGEDTTSSCIRLGLDAKRCIAIDVFGDLYKHRSIMTSPATLEVYRDAAVSLFSNDGSLVSVLRDSNGFVFQRVIACIVNVACEIAQLGIATPETIDKAVILGLGYPMGPLAMGDYYGTNRILSILEILHRDTGDPRYRPSTWLRRRAGLSLPLTHAEL